MGKLSDLLKGNEFKSSDTLGEKKAEKKPIKGSFADATSKIFKRTSLTEILREQKIKESANVPDRQIEIPGPFDSFDDLSSAFKAPPKTFLPITSDRASNRGAQSFRQQELAKMKEATRLKTIEVKAKEEQRKKSFSGANERISILEEEDSRKFGRNVPEPDVDEQNRIRDELIDARNIKTANAPGVFTGIRKGLGLNPTSDFAVQKESPGFAPALEVAESQKGFTTGLVGTELVKQVALYATVGKAVRGTQFIKNLGSKIGGSKLAQLAASKFGDAAVANISNFTAGQIGELFVDAVIQIPQEISRGDIDKIGWNRLFDLGFNLGIGAGEQFFKSIKNLDPAGFDKALKNLSPEDAKTVRDTLGVKPTEFAPEAVGPTLRQPQVGSIDSKVPISPITSGFETPTKSAIDNFQTWRSKNFGGATGKQSPDDIRTLRDLYFEDTGKYIGDVDLKSFTKLPDLSITQTELENRMFKDLTDNLGKLKESSVDLPKLSTTVDGTVSKKPLSDLIRNQSTAEAAVKQVEPATQAAKIDDSIKATVSLPKPDLEAPTQALKREVPKPKLPTMTLDESTLKSQMAGGDVDSAMAKIVKRTKKDKKTIKQVALDAHKQFVDSLTPFKTLEKNITGRKKLASAEESFYKTAINSKGAPARAEELLRQNVEPIIKKVEKDGYSIKEFETYALMKHAEDVNAAGMKSGFSDEEIKAVIDKYSNTSLETYRKDLMKFQNNTLQEMFDGDLLTKESLDALNNKWKNYMPLSRQIDDKKVEFLKGIDGSFNNVSDGLQTLKGSDKKVLSPLESIYQNIYKSQDAIAKNKVGVRLAELSKQDTDGSLIRRLEEGEEIGRKNVITVKIKGEPVKFEVEPDVFKTFNNMDKESSAWLLKILQKPASLLRIGATTTLEFSARNPMKDIQDAFIKAPNGFNPFVDFGIGLMDTIKKGPWYSDFMKSSGGYSNFLSPDQATKHVKTVLKKGPVKGFVNIINPVNWVKTVSAISNATESATKVGVFRRAIKAGETPAEAAFQARSIMDFARVGSSIKEANKVVAFLNSSIQGKSTMIRSIKDNPKKVLAKIGAATVVPTVGVAANNHFLANDIQKKNIEDSPQWLKDTFWQIAIPGTDIVARLPKSFETAVISNGIERGLNKLLLDDKDAYDDYFKRSIKDVTNIPWMLTGLTGFVEAIANYSFFREGDIIPLREQGIKKEDQFDSRTSEVAKTVAGAIQFLTKGDSNFTSPRIIDNLIKSGTGGLGQTALNSLDYLLDKSGIANKPDKPKKDITQLPLLKGLLVNSQQSGQSVGNLYDLRQKLQEEKGSAKLAYGPADLKPLKFKFDKQDTLDIINEGTKLIGEISKELRMINESFDLSAEEKKIKIDKLIKERNNIARETMRKVE